MPISRTPGFRPVLSAIAEALLSRLAQLAMPRQSGGNLLQRTRSDISRRRQRLQQTRPGHGCDARDGENRIAPPYSAGAGPASHPPVGFLRAARRLDAVVEIEGRTGRREVAVEALHCRGDTPERESILEPGDLIIALRLPGEARRFSAHSRYLKVRNALLRPSPSCRAAAGDAVEDRHDPEGAAGVGGVAAKPWRARSAETILAAQARRQRLPPRGEAPLMTRTLRRNGFKIELAQRGPRARSDARRGGTPQWFLPFRPPLSLRFRSVHDACDQPRSSACPCPKARTSVKPLTRREGILKVKGEARYAADNHLRDAPAVLAVQAASRAVA